MWSIAARHGTPASWRNSRGHWAYCSGRWSGLLGKWVQGSTWRMVISGPWVGCHFTKGWNILGRCMSSRSKKSLAPSYISSHFRLVSSVHSYGLRQCNMNYSLSGCPFPPKSFTRSAILFWNSLPSELKSSESLRIFRKGLISYLKQD